MRSAIICGSEYWALNNKGEIKTKDVEIRTIKWMRYDETRLVKIRN